MQTVHQVKPAPYISAYDFDFAHTILEGFTSFKFKTASEGKVCLSSEGKKHGFLAVHSCALQAAAIAVQTSS